MIPATTIGKLAKLIPRLASNHDGEVVATARAIIATLKSEGRDLHDLAKMLEDAHAPFSYAASARTWRPPENPSTQPSPSPQPKKQKSAGRPTTNLWRVIRRSDRTKWLNMILEKGDLESSERELIAKVLQLLHVGMAFELGKKDERALYDILARFTVEAVYK